MRSILLVLIFFLSLSAKGQEKLDDRALLEKTKSLYDTPFRRGLINFDCGIDFDIERHIKDNFGPPTPTGIDIIRALKPITYRVFADHSGATVSVKPKLPELHGVLHASELEEANRSLLQIGLSNWVPHAFGELLPLGPTKYHFERTVDGYKLAMTGDNLDTVLTLSEDLHITGGTVEKPMHIELTSNYIHTADGLVLGEASVNTNHMGLARLRYTYQTVDSYQIPEFVTVSSEQNQTWKYRLTDCKTSHGQVVKVQPPTKN